MSYNNQFIPRPSQYGSSQPDINILMMGETGIGKSTIINAFVNHLVHNTRNDAIRGEMQVLVPSTFHMTDPTTFNEKKISVGNPSDDEKSEEIGQSSTQVCQSYIFPIGNRILRLIDALMFIFTNARSTFYRPGSTTPLIRSLLQELNQKWNVQVPFNIENTFMFDNESFRFLATYKNGMKFSGEEVSQFSQSWEKSVEEFSRLIERVLKCDTHAVRDSLSINSAQQLIRKLTRPVGIHH